jgi:hypothetical protein
VVLVRDVEGRLCSGTHVLPHVVLTAAHCVEGSRRVAVMVDGELSAAERVIVHPRYPNELDDPSTPSDLALVVLPKWTGHATPRPLGLRHEALTAGEHVTLIGFGGTTPAERRIGRDVYMPGNRRSPSGTEDNIALTEHARGRLYLEGAPNDFGPRALGASADHGDSGAPLLGEDGRIAGVVIAVSRVRGGRDPHRVTWASDVTLSPARPFLERELARLGRDVLAKLHRVFSVIPRG